MGSRQKLISHAPVAHFFSKYITGFFKGVSGIRFGSLESEKIGSLQAHTGYLTFSLKKLYIT